MQGSITAGFHFKMYLWHEFRKNLFYYDYDCDYGRLGLWLWQKKGPAANKQTQKQNIAHHKHKDQKNLRKLHALCQQSYIPIGQGEWLDLKTLMEVIKSDLRVKKLEC